MKQSLANNDRITKKDLSSALEKTKQELDQAMKYMEIRLDMKLDKMEQRIDLHAQRYNSEILSRFDNWAGELENARIDRTLGTRQLQKLSDKVKEHDKRIKKLEKN